MPKKRMVKRRRAKQAVESYSMFLSPVVGGVLAWLLSGNLTLGFVIFIAILGSNWYYFRKICK